MASNEKPIGLQIRDVCDRIFTLLKNEQNEEADRLLEEWYKKAEEDKELEHSVFAKMPLANLRWCLKHPENVLKQILHTGETYSLGVCG